MASDKYDFPYLTESEIKKCRDDKKSLVDLNDKRKREIEFQGNANAIAQGTPLQLKDNPKALEYYNHFVYELDQRNGLSSLDKTSLIHASQISAWIDDLAKDIQVEGKIITTTNSKGETVSKQNPSLKTYLDLVKEFHFYESNFGLTLLSREKLIKVESDTPKLINNASDFDQIEQQNLDAAKKWKARQQEKLNESSD